MTLASLFFFCIFSKLSRVNIQLRLFCSYQNLNAASNSVGGNANWINHMENMKNIPQETKNRSM